MADRPVAKYRVKWSQLSFAFWDNNRKLPSITLTKSWRDDKGEWHNQNISITRRDMVELAHQLPRAIALYDKTSNELRQKKGPSQSKKEAKKPGFEKKAEEEVITYSETAEFVG